MNLIYDNLGRTERFLIENLIGTSYVVDLGVVTATDQSTVDVQHAVIQVRYGKELPPTVTRKVEVVWLFPGVWNLKAGDVVLLLGLKDYVKRAQGASVSKTDVPLHYTQATLKAVPIRSSSAPTVIAVDSANLVQIKNAAASLYTAIQNLVQGIQGGTYGGAGAPGPFVDTTGKVATALTQLGQIMKA
jgi:hypothetical protein